MNRIVSVEWLTQHIEDSNLVILDASAAGNQAGLKTAFEGLIIKGARYFDMKEVFVDKSNPLPGMLPSAVDFSKGCQLLGIDQDSQIVIYDNLGIYHSPRAWWMFQAMGHERVAVLDGGLSAWVNAGLPTVNHYHVSNKKGNFQAKLNTQQVVDFDDMMTNLTHKTHVVLDARSEGRFCGTAPEPRVGLPSGHIPESFNLPFDKVLKDGHYLPQEDLIHVFESFKIGDQPVIFTCGSGLTACIIYLAYAIIGDNFQSIYDGSWTEWGGREDAPIA